MRISILLCLGSQWNLDLPPNPVSFPGLPILEKNNNSSSCQKTSTKKIILDFLLSLQLPTQRMGIRPVLLTQLPKYIENLILLTTPTIHQTNFIFHCSHLFTIHRLPLLPPMSLRICSNSASLSHKFGSNYSNVVLTTS